ncbi:zinc-binding dehydrogenase [Sinorhizobium meliloti]|nr:zinc-binding dehydrogenase [Sinorhizobium meliloti]MDX0212037.1 zinc-binding dehydrogenase [Sinorhizobium meliloti]
MRKIVVRRPGGPGVLRLVVAAVPRPAGDDVLIHVEAAGVNFADCVARMGLYRSSWELVGWPFTPGFEVAGTVASVGEGVADLAPGTPVMAVTRFGGYAEQVVVPRAQVFPIPEHLSFAEAAALPVSFLTALYAFELAALRRRADVLVHSAAGATGSAIAQVSRLYGCRVVGVVGAAWKSDTAKRAGCAEVVVRSRTWHREVAAHSPEGYAAVFDANGDTLRRSFSLVAPMGRLVVYGSHGIMSHRGLFVDIPATILRYALMRRFGALELANANISIMAFNLSYLFRETERLRRMVGTLFKHVNAGRLSVPPIEAFDLADAAAAHRKLQSGDTTGKLVLSFCRPESSSLKTPQ